MNDTSDYYGNYYDDDAAPTVADEVDLTESTDAISATTSTASTISYPENNTVSEVITWGGTFSVGSTSPDSKPETASPFGGGNPYVEPEQNPGAGSRPQGFISFVEPEAEPNNFNRLATRLVDGACLWEQNPWGEPEPEPEGEPFGEPEGEHRYPYAEPPAPLLQSSRYMERGTYGTFAAIVGTLIIVLNIAVLVVLSRKPKQRKSLSYLLGLIAAFDILGGVQFLWFSSFDVHLMFTHANMWILVMCGIWMLSMAPQIAAMLHFGLHLLNELQVGVNNAKISGGRIAFIVLTVFAFPIGLFIPPIAGWNCIGCENSASDLYYCAKKCSMAIFPFTKIYVLLMVVLLFSAMILVISIYATIYWTICQKECERRLSPKSGKADVIRVTALLLVVYILCVIPVSIVMVFDYISVKCNPRVINAFHATLFVSFLSNLMNPIVVFCTLPSMRNTSRAATITNGKSRDSWGTTEKKEKNGFSGPYVSDEMPPHENDVPPVEEAQDATKV